MRPSKISSGSAKPRSGAGHGLRSFRPFLVAVLCVFLGAVHADVRLPRLLGNGVVLQRDVPNEVWGWADENESVSVTLDGTSVGTAKASNGEWRLSLDAMPAGGPHRLEITGRNRVIVDDVWFGDVWVASGQSNMQLPMERIKEAYGDDIERADFPQVRMFTVPRTYDFTGPREDVEAGEWLPATPENVLDFSAVAFYFARELNRELGVPIGVISSNFGGSPAEGWMSEEALEAWPGYLETALRYRDAPYLEALIRSDREYESAWYRDVDGNDAGLAGPVPWFDPSYDASGWDSMTLPGVLEERGLAPMNGVIWLKKTFDLPASDTGKPARLMLGRLVDADKTWVNGVTVGETTYQYPPRRYTVDAGVLHEGENTVTVRLVSNANPAAFIEDKPYFVDTGDARIELDGSWRYRVGTVSPPLEPPRFLQYKQPLGFYNAMLAPLLRTSIKGVIWYQGESNTDRPAEYVRLFPAMIRDWRKQWDQGDFPFLFVQLANFMEARDEPGESAWAETREAQRLALSEPNTAMVVAIDAGEWNDIHPLNKRVVGQRLALAARTLAYGETGLAGSGPALRSVRAASGALELEFDDSGSGLAVEGKALSGFEVAGKDGLFFRADAVLSGDRIIVSSPRVDAPVLVRYAWADNPEGANLYNAEGLPASPFQAGVTGEAIASRSPVAVGNQLVANLLSRDYMLYGDEALHYAEAAAAVGALRFAAATGNRVMLRTLVSRYEALLEEDSGLVSRRAHVDMNVIGIVPLQIAMDTGDARFLRLGLELADSQWANPTEDGLTGQTRWWIDDLYMVGMLQIQAWRATGNPVYADRAARQLAAYLPRLQRDNGLFYHSPDVPIFWGRGNGWVAVAMAEVLSSLPAEHELYEPIAAHYRLMMQSLLAYQGEDGMWKQVVDLESAWDESSATAMFAYAMLLGVQGGLLDGDTYPAAVQRAWVALTKRIDRDGNVEDVCVGTGKKNDLDYYLARPRVAGDFHGQAPMLWLAAGLVP